MSKPEEPPPPPKALPLGFSEYYSLRMLDFSLRATLSVLSLSLI